MWTYLPIEDRNVESNSDLSELNCGFLSDPRLLNTAVTRAQSLLAVVGDPMSLCSVGACRNLWKDYLRRCDANKGLYGCTLKTVMDFCLNSQALDPTAQEFIPGESVQVKKDENGRVLFSCKLMKVVLLFKAFNLIYGPIFGVLSISTHNSPPSELSFHFTYSSMVLNR